VQVSLRIVGSFNSVKRARTRSLAALGASRVSRLELEELVGVNDPSEASFVVRPLFPPPSPSDFVVGEDRQQGENGDGTVSQSRDLAIDYNPAVDQTLPPSRTL